MEVKVTQYGPLSINYTKRTITIRYRMTHELFNKVEKFLTNKHIEYATHNFITFVAVESFEIIDTIKNISKEYRKCQSSGKSLQQ